MTLVSWLIVIVPLLFIIGAAFYSKRYVRDIADYLACGRVAGRYVLCVGDLAASLSVITLVAMVEQNYQVGSAIGFWNSIMAPLFIFISLTGYCVYRYRQTRALSVGQFLEQRYSRSFRIVAAAVRTFAEMVTNAIGPAVAVRFFIYFLGIPHKIPFLGFEIPTYGVMVALLLIMALAIVWPAGRISLLITDCFQGIISYPIFVIFTVFVLTQISWFSDVTPVLLDRVPGESFLNPMDVSALRDFNLFALIVTMVSSVLNRAAWFGNDASSAGRNAHEQKMAGILGSWRNGFSFMMLGMVALFVITVMHAGRFTPQAHEVRVDLSKKIAEEIIENPEVRTKVVENISPLEPISHQIGVDPPYSRENNPDTPFLNTTLETLRSNNSDDAVANSVFQKFRSLYYQMMMPILLGKVFSPVLMGLFTLLMFMLLLSTDDSRIFNASSTLVQDVIMPLKKNPMSMKEHLLYLKLCSLGTVVFFFVVSLFFVQLDFINMFITIMCGVWLGGAGPIMVGGLYTRFGTTFGAWCALIFGSGTSALGLIFQRNWPDIIYPCLERWGYIEPIGNFLETVSKPFHPYIVWTMDPIKFPINSMEIYFISMVLGVLAYVLGSWITYKGPYNLDRLLHRGKYSDDPNYDYSVSVEESTWSWRGLYKKLIGITPEYTTGDKILAWSVFIWSIVISFVVLFCGSVIWNMISPWPPERWSMYFFITGIVIPLIIGVVSTVWFMIGGIIDSRQMFSDLEKRVANPLDDGRVEGNVSLADKARFDKIEHQNESEK